MDALTTRRLDALAKLYVAGIDGAEDELTEMLRERTDELPGVLGCSRSTVEGFRGPHAVSRFVGAITASARRTRTDRIIRSQDAARTLAAELAQSAQHVGDVIVLDAESLARVLRAWPGNGVLALGGRGVGLARLRALLRECRRVERLGVEVHERFVAVNYETRGARGAVHLALNDVPRDIDALVVPIDEVRRTSTATAPIVAPEAVTAPTRVETESVVASVPARVATRQRRRSPALRFLDAIAAALGAS